LSFYFYQNIKKTKNISVGLKVTSEEAAEKCSTPETSPEFTGAGE